MVDIDPIYSGLDGSLAERGASAGNVFAHDTPEPGQGFRVNGD
jgi:hypothetical protein